MRRVNLNDPLCTLAVVVSSRGKEDEYTYISKYQNLYHQIKKVYRLELLHANLLIY